ncbi:MAG: protein kinase [Phycisphaerae bacterium]|jgi:serine/threonine protein kinase
MKRCPYCAEEIQDEAVKCKHCGENLAGHSTDTLDKAFTIQAKKDESQYDTLGGAETLLGKSNTFKNNQTGSLDGEPTLVNSQLDNQNISPIASGQIQQSDTFESRYEILDILGSGGMGVVYKARDRKLRREVAIKRLHGKADAEKKGIERFLQEAQVIAALNHENIVTIYDVNEDNASPFIVMEYIQGQNLQDRIEKNGKIELVKSLSIIKEIGQALSYAHRRSIIHRDIKPSNIIISEDGTPKLLDFGLAQLGRESELSVTGYGMGTLAYMAPEQKRDAKHADHRADIYSLAKTLYHMVTGELPDAVDLDTVSNEICPALKRALKPNPQDRQFTVDDFVKELEQSDKIHIAAASNTTGIGTCIECGAVNSEDVKFCQTCGAGLFEKCPKCEHEDRVGVKHCGSCGVNIARFKEAHDAFDQAFKYYEEKKYSRAIKEAKRGMQTGYMNQEFSNILKQSEESIHQIETLKSEIMSLVGQQNYEQAQQLIPELLKEDSSLDDIKKLQDEFPSLIIKREIEKAQKALADTKFGNGFDKCWNALKFIEHALEYDSTNKKVLKLRDEVQRALWIRQAIAFLIMIVFFLILFGIPMIIGR